MELAVVCELNSQWPESVLNFIHRIFKSMDDCDMKLSNNFILKKHKGHLWWVTIAEVKEDGEHTDLMYLDSSYNFKFLPHMTIEKNNEISKIIIREMVCYERLKARLEKELTNLISEDSLAAEEEDSLAGEEEDSLSSIL